MHQKPLLVARHCFLSIATIMLMLGCGGSDSQPDSAWAGEYDNGNGVKLTLVAGQDGSFGGELLQHSNGVDARFPVNLQAAGNALEGLFESGSDSYPLRIEPGVEPAQVVITSEGALYVLSRVGGGSGNPLVAAHPPSRNPLTQSSSDLDQAQAAPSRAPVAEQVTAEKPVQKTDNRHASGRNVVINGQRIDDARLRSLEGPTPTIPDGNYWYDSKSGMAGNINGPTQAYLAAGTEFCRGKQHECLN